MCRGDEDEGDGVVMMEVDSVVRGGWCRLWEVAAMVVMVLGVNDTMAGVGVVLHSEGYDCGSMGYGGGFGGGRWLVLAVGGSNHGGDGARCGDDDDGGVGVVKRR
ncbi:hypothetical protein Tco_1049924 [Tanacetum coccineum]